MIGKAMFGGRVLYRDVFDQKGPLIFFVHGLAGLVQSDGFLGVWLLEIAAGAVFLWYCYKIFALYGFDRLGWVALPLVLAASFSTVAFQMGDCVEQLCLPLFAAGLYVGLATLHSPRCMGWRAAFVQGILAGCVFWCKFNLCAFWGAMGLVLFIDCLQRGGVTKAVSLTGGFLGGFSATSLPWLAYFAVNGAMSDLWEAYFYNNLFLYSGSRNFMGILQSGLQGMADQLLKNWTFGLLVLLGLVWALLWPGRRWTERAFPVLALLFLAVGVYGVGASSFAYYAMAFVTFVPLGFLPLLWLAQRLIETPSLKRLAKPKVLAGIACVLGVSFAFWHTPNRPLFGQPRAAAVQYQFAQVIEQAQDQSLVVWRHLDNGFFTALDRVPEEKYIGAYNLDIPEIEALRTTVPDPAETAFVVSSCEEKRRNIYKAEKEPLLLEAGYVMVADGREEYLTGGGYLTTQVYLYQRAEDAARR